MTRIFLGILSVLLTFNLGLIEKSHASNKKIDPKACTFKGKKLFGKVKVVESFPDLKIKKVTSFPDLKVKWVNSFPDKCGKWKKTNSFPDIKIKYVESFPDLRIQIVDSFPGIP